MCEKINGYEYGKSEMNMCIMCACANFLTKLIEN